MVSRAHRRLEDVSSVTDTSSMFIEADVARRSWHPQHCDMDGELVAAVWMSLGPAEIATTVASRPPDAIRTMHDAAEVRMSECCPHWA